MRGLLLSTLSESSHSVTCTCIAHAGRRICLGMLSNRAKPRNTSPNPAHSCSHGLVRRAQHIEHTYGNLSQLASPHEGIMPASHPVHSHTDTSCCAAINESGEVVLPRHIEKRVAQPAALHITPC